MINNFELILGYSHFIRVLLIFLRSHMTWIDPLTKCQFHKMVKHTQPIRRQFADELFECVSQFCGIGA